MYLLFLFISLISAQTLCPDQDESLCLRNCKCAWCSIEKVCIVNSIIPCANFTQPFVCHSTQYTWILLSCAAFLSLLGLVFIAFLTVCCVHIISERRRIKQIQHANRRYGSFK